MYKNKNRFKKLKLKREKKKRGKLHRTQKPNVETAVYVNNKKCD